MTEQTQSATPRSLGGAAVVALVGGLFTLLAATLALPRAQESPGLRAALLVAVAGLALGMAWVTTQARRRGARLTVELAIRRPHLVQLLLHSSVYAYWGWHWEPVAGQVPLILAQVVFAYLFDLVLCWGRYGNFRLGLGPFPIVGSTNLFLWFKDPLYGAQLAMIAGSILAREFLKWRRGGQRVHIFNPSAISLCLAAVALLATRSVDLSWGPEISQTLGWGPYAYEQIFLAGLVAQLFFGVTWVTASAALTTVGLTALYHAVTGGHFFVDTAIPIAVFLGMTLLVTDPVSSPYTLGGKMIFGALYGVTVMALYVPLLAMEVSPGPGQPVMAAAFFDKLLQVPLLNLSVRWIDRIGAWMNVERLLGRLSRLRARAVHVGVWAVAFVLIRPSLNAHPGRDPLFWRGACASASAPDACENHLRVLSGLCQRGTGLACLDGGQALEFGDGLPVDLGGAAALYERGCQQGVGDACSHLGGLVIQHGQDEAAPMRARALFAEACARGSAEGCQRLAVVRAQGLGGPRDPAGAQEARRAGCALGDQAACQGR